jgi:hypothetical protein
MAAVGDLACAECGREPRSDENADDGSRTCRRWRDPVSECAEREIGLSLEEALQLLTDSTHPKRRVTP